MDVNDTTYGIRGAVFEVNRVLGPGFLEKVYENALLIELRSRGYTAESQVPIKVYYKENVVEEYIKKESAIIGVNLRLKILCGLGSATG